MREWAGLRIGRAVAALVATLALCACLGGIEIPAPGVRDMAVYDGSARVRAPEGYCIDTASSRPASGFAVMGGCALLSQLQIMPQSRAMVTVQFGPRGSAAVDGAEVDLHRLIRSAQGAALLSSSGQPDAILVEAIETGPGLVMVRFADSAPPIAAGLEQVEWRAFLDLSGRLATVTVRGFARAPLDRAAGLALLQEAVAAQRLANGVPGAAADG